MVAPETDILVAGGGPAGCLAALGLTRLGHRVQLITSPRRPSIEGLSERVLRALEANECRAALASVGPMVRREAGWNGEISAANAEWVVANCGTAKSLMEGYRVVVKRVLESGR